MYEVFKDQFSTAMVKTIPMKVVSWVKLLDKYEEYGDGEVDLNVAEINIQLHPQTDNAPQGGSITAPDGTCIDWQGDFENMYYLRVSEFRLTDVASNIDAFIEVEKKFYDRLHDLQMTIMAEQNAEVNKAMEDAISNMERDREE